MNETKRNENENNRKTMETKLCKSVNGTADPLSSTSEPTSSSKLWASWSLSSLSLENEDEIFFEESDDEAPLDDRLLVTRSFSGSLFESDLVLFCLIDANRIKFKPNEKSNEEIKLNEK